MHAFTSHPRSMGTKGASFRGILEMNRQRLRRNARQLPTIPVTARVAKMSGAIPSHSQWPRAAQLRIRHLTCGQNYMGKQPPMARKDRLPARMQPCTRTHKIALEAFTPLVWGCTNGHPLNLAAFPRTAPDLPPWQYSNAFLSQGPF